MNNQEIYDKVGDIGVLTTTFMCMSQADGNFSDEELQALFKLLHVFSNDPKDAIENTVSTIKDLSFAEKIQFAFAGLKMFSEKTDSNTKGLIMQSLEIIAESDGEVSSNEKAFYADVKKILQA